jgi:hypothetical protein
LLTLDTLARLHGDTEEAATLREAADALFPAVAHQVTPADRWDRSP